MDTLVQKPKAQWKLSGGPQNLSPTLFFLIFDSWLSEKRKPRGMCQIAVCSCFAPSFPVKVSDLEAYRCSTSKTACPLVGSGILNEWILLKASHFVWSWTSRAYILLRVGVGVVDIIYDPINFSIMYN